MSMEYGVRDDFCRFVPKVTTSAEVFHVVSSFAADYDRCMVWQVVDL